MEITTPSELVERIRHMLKFGTDQMSIQVTLMQAADCIEMLSVELAEANLSSVRALFKSAEMKVRAETAEKELAKKSEWLDCAHQLLKNAEKMAAKYKEALHELAAGMAAIGRLDLLDIIESALTEDGTCPE